MPAVIWKGSSALIEMPTSPEHVLGENITMIRSWKGPHSVCVGVAPYRGALGSGLSAGYRVAEARVAREKGGIGMLSVRYEINGQPPGASLPPTVQGLSFEVAERALRYHPLFVTLTREMWGYVTTVVETADDNPSHADALLRIGALPGAPEALCYKAIEKMQRGNTHYQISQTIFTRTTYFWTAPTGISAGNVRQVPSAPGLTLPTGVDWLRQGDSVNFNGSVWERVERYIGAPGLDPEIYPVG